MNQLCKDINANLIVKDYLHDIDSLNLFKTCKHQYNNIHLYKIKCKVSYKHLINFRKKFKMLYW